MIDALRDETYMVRHNPNCPMPFEVRTCGTAGFVTDTEPRNFVGYGKTADEAAAKVIEKINLKRFAPVFRELWDGL
jgi:hypothetical protein